MATTQNGIYYQDDYTKNADILADMKEMAESVDEVVQEEKENQETIEQKIQELQTEQTAQNKKIEEIDDNQIHITTEKAESINVQDASGQNAKINVFGISKQETNGASPSPEYPSKIENTGDNINYFDISKITNKGALTNNGDGSLTMQNNENTLGFIQINQTLKQLCPELKAGDIIAFSFKTTTQNSTYKDRIYAGDFLFNGESKEITQAMLDAYVCFYGGYNEISTISNIKIEKGTKTTSYSPYKCGSVEITDCNKNIFNVDEFKDFFDLTETGTDEGHNYVAYTTKSYANNKFMQGKFKANTQYTISFLGRQKQVGQGQTSGFVFNYTDGTSSIKYVNNDEIWTEYTLISDKNKTIDYIFMAWAYGGTIWLSDIQLEVNNVTTDYIEREQQTITFPLVQGQKMYKESETEDDGIHHKRKQVELDGTEDWIELGINYYLTINDKKTRFELTKGKILCTHFKETTAGVTGEVKVGEFFEGYYLTGNRNVFFNYDNGAGGIDNWKTYLAQQKQAGTPVIVEYELAEEEIEAYTEEQQTAYNQLQNAKTYKTETNVFTENAEVEMEYVAHTKTYVDNEINSVKEQLNTIKELLSTTTTSAMLLDNLQTDLESEVL